MAGGGGGGAGGAEGAGAGGEKPGECENVRVASLFLDVLIVLTNTVFAKAHT